MKPNTLSKLTIHEIQISANAKSVFEAWRDKAQRPNAVIFEDLIRFAIENGFEPSGKDRRLEPVN